MSFMGVGCRVHKLDGSLPIAKELYPNYLEETVKVSKH